MGRVPAVVATAAAILLGLTGSASAAFSTTPTRTIPIGSFGIYGDYAPGFDGTFWTVSGGSTPPSVVGHVDDEGHDLGDGFDFGLPYPIGIAYYGGRVYIHVGDQFFRIASYTTDGGDFLHEDEETSFRLGSTQVNLRAYPNGLGTVGLGQLGKVATLDLSKNVAGSPWYPMAFHGNGVNDPNYQVTGNAFETCSLDGEGVVIGEPDPACGHFSYVDTGNGTHPGFNYAIDTAPGLGASTSPTVAATG